MTANKLLYKTVYNDLKKGIKNGTFPVGSFLPTENDLCRQHSVSRTTVRKALSMLESEGYLRITQGRGTEVLEASTTQNLLNISSITETLKAKGYDVTVHGMSIQKQAIPGFLTDKLQLPKNHSIYKVERLLYADNHPIAYIVNYMNADPVPNLEMYVNSFTGLYSFLEQNYNIVLTEALETLSASVADFTEAHLLHVPIGSPLLCSKRLSSINGRPFEFSDSKLVADRYEFSIYLQGRSYGKSSD
jgi:GntR family transcriptional regulator